MKCLQIKDKPLEYICDPFAWGPAPHDYAAIAAYKLGFYHEAYFHGLNAVEISKNDERLRKNLMIFIQHSVHFLQKLVNIILK